MQAFRVLSTCVLAFAASCLHSFVTAEDLKLEARLPPCELIKYFGYPCVTTYATTEDGYILEVYRIAHGIQGNTSGTASQKNDRLRRPPVLLVPPLLAAVDVYFFNLPSQSPGYLFADNGFDVWAMSMRENKPYISHKTLSPDEPEYWQFSFDEMGRYDVAACIDHVLNATGASKLTVVGFSQGTLANFILHSTRPEYSKKKLVYPFTQAGFLGSTNGLRKLFTIACSLLGSLHCDVGFVLTSTSSSEQLNKTRIPVYLGHFPIGSSVQNFLHFYQIYKAKNLVMYDHGEEENRRRYGQETPPPYPLERIRVPIALFSSQGDILADQSDVADLAYRLGSNLVLNYIVPQPSFCHQDFVGGNRANDILHNIAIELAKKYSSQNP
ncbi:gastric triacylglycerol lipase-like isoform X2 [Dermacentor variabilis]|uniref:gastric triacylglycerol lipase-like isoform X2 n=1 Tax=Dermacentor variabilis TaxID=34621 RepID=UPI003F5C8370